MPGPPTLGPPFRAEPLPTTAEEIEALVDSIASLRVLRGYRRQPPGDVAALVEVTLRVGELALALGSRLREIDLIPVLVGPRGRGAIPVDVLIVMADPA